MQKPKTLRAFFEQYARKHRKRRSSNTTERYRTAVRQLCRFAENGAALTVDQVDDDLIGRFHSWLLTTGVTVPTAGKYRRYVRMVCRQANPEAFPKHSYVHKGTQTPYRRHSLRRFFEDENYWTKLLTLAGFQTGKRQGPQKLRRTSASYLELASPGSAQYHLGHASADLARRHYLDPRIVRPVNTAELLPRPKMAKRKSR